MVEGTEYRISMPEPGKTDQLWRPACGGGRALLPALGRIIYFSISGREEARSAQPPPVRRLGRSAEAQRRCSGFCGCRVAAGLQAWDLLAGSSDAGGVTQVAAGRGEAEAKRYHQRLLWGAGGATGDGPSLPLVPLSPNLLLSGCSRCLCDIPPGT